ncbi:hypothetical protein B0H17DRAFT_1336198 [Mycena rosella]|uniref:Uncharacterized protein n=1 Tax=Mycena rosella TaxID=1033263 RepID=A0AAD7CWJ9_MYCRO|nr:hypothetical protein B0H17DRAFT_1336198 [Mycena rosella]
MRPNGSQTLTSASFMKLYNSLPPETRQSLVEKKLAPLLDCVPKERAKKVMKSVNLLQTRYSDVPVLDLRAKKREINGLLDELARDGKRAIVRERSNRDELLAEIVDSIVSWLNDIWTVVYDYNVLFDEAHACLLYVAEVLNMLSSIPGIGGHCRCSISHLSISLAIRRRGKIIKKFSLAGPRGIDRALLWIWRDLFVSMFAKGKHTEKIPEMLADIEEYLNWEALELMLYGGSKCRAPNYEDDDEGVEADAEACLQDEFSDDDSWRCQCRLHASHWSEIINDQRTALRDLVHQHLVNIFELTPSHAIFTSILAICADPEKTEAALLNTLSHIAGTSADTLVAALDIHGSEGNPAALVALLDDHSYLLRPRDAPALQATVTLLSEFSAFHAYALQLAERELLDTAAAVRAAVRTAFSRVEHTASVQALADILKLRSDNVHRRPRIDAWVESVLTPGRTALHPMAFAAMMMGFPLAAGMEDGGDDMDVLAYLDMEQPDPDLEDLRWEFRPKLRERFEAWVGAVMSMRAGSALLGRLYAKILEEMPYFKTSDVADEMLNRLGERPNKTHVLEAVEGVLTFCKTQRKRISARAEKRRKNEAKKAVAAEAAAAAGSAPAPAPPTPLPPHITQRAGYPFSVITTSHPSNPAAGPSSSPFPAGIGGMEDVD